MTRNLKSREVQRRRSAGWKTPVGTVYVGRPTRWGNPFLVYRTITIQASELGIRVRSLDSTIEIEVGGVAESIGLYRVWLHRMIELHRRAGEDFLGPLVGKNLSCWCPVGWNCHRRVLLEVLAIREKAGIPAGRTRPARSRTR